MQVARSNQEHTTVAHLEDRLALFKPIKVDELETKHGLRLCCECEVWLVGDDGAPESVGVVGVFNEVLLRVLASNIGEMLGGRIERPGRAYIFADLSDAEIARCERAERIVTGAPDFVEESF